MMKGIQKRYQYHHHRVLLRLTAYSLQLSCNLQLDEKYQLFPPELLNTGNSGIKYTRLLLAENLYIIVTF
jgi:hypothetical protein